MHTSGGAGVATRPRSETEDENESHRRESNPLPSALQTEERLTQTVENKTTCDDATSSVAHPVVYFKNQLRDVAGAWPRLSKAHRLAILDIINEPRKHDGMTLAATKTITEGPRGWLVPSQSDDSVYTVRLDLVPARCSCTDSMTRKLKCKHIWAVEMVRARG